MVNKCCINFIWVVDHRKWNGEATQLVINVVLCPQFLANMQLNIVVRVPQRERERERERNGSLNIITEPFG